MQKYNISTREAIFASRKYKKTHIQNQYPEPMSNTTLDKTVELSIIICSIQPELLAKCSANIKQTIGISYEIISIDNRVCQYSIAHAYNEGARQARGRFLLFQHEDVIYEQAGWGKILANKLSDERCGVVGFAGSFLKSRAYSGWAQYLQNSTCACFSYYRNGIKQTDYHGNPGRVGFVPVVTVDGFAMAVRREVWVRYPFDEVALTGFHCYDLDFSLELAKHYENAVCFEIKVCHSSNGNFNEAWQEATIHLHRTKWNSFLPMKVYPFSTDEMATNEAENDYGFLWHAIRSSLPTSIVHSLFCEFLTKSLRSKLYFRHLPVIFWQYFIKRVV